MDAFSAVPRPITILAICLKVRPSEGSGTAPQRRIIRSNSSLGLPADDNISGCRLRTLADAPLYHKFEQNAVIRRSTSKFGDPPRCACRFGFTLQVKDRVQFRCGLYYSTVAEIPFEALSPFTRG